MHYESPVNVKKKCYFFLACDLRVHYILWENLIDPDNAVIFTLNQFDFGNIAVDMKTTNISVHQWLFYIN